MITKENFKKLLQKLAFEEKNNVFTKTFKEVSLQVDFAKGQIIYPENQGLKVNERQTCNFSSAENFVVFECVHRLLEKGYLPQHLELEPKWKVGHGASGGRADILVRDHEEKPLLLIECKTWGDEYEKEKQKMLSNGGQLFSYFQQEKDTKYLCLYASDFKEEKITYENAIIKTQDRKEDIEAFKNGDESIKLYEKAKNNKALFEVWKETFNLYFHYNGIFEYDVNAYEIELKPLKKKDLKPFTGASGIFNQFMEILRHNNISDNANAFNRFLSLLLCKIVDEEKGGHAVLDFQVKEGEDTPENIQDRLQRLYAKGMEEHLGQEIVYFEDQKIKDIIDSYSKVSKIREIEHIFKQIKYYTQNEFALKEVHNETLFKENARVLNEVIKMLQNYRFRYTKKQQILGDFFELILNHGIKQNEGQFFTPVPIVRFMILSLGLNHITDKKLQAGTKSFLPKILDYACGAGHFLTESIDELQKNIDRLDLSQIDKIDVVEGDKEVILNNAKSYKDNTLWAKDYIFGIEKDYRLARTSQIACFLNGDGDANIIYGDGLEDHDRLDCKEEKNLFDVILSNPPYSIKSFKNYLPVNEKQFSLFKYLTESSKEIENLFIERTAQLLKEGGRAAIILPSSILSNDSDLHRATRKIILEHFNIKAIASFGSGTFGATGTNTVVLFLEKRHFWFAYDRGVVADEIFTTGKKENYLDRDKLLDMFLSYRGLNKEDYKTLIDKNPNENIQDASFYKNYQDWFNKLPSTENLKKKTSFKHLSLKDQETRLNTAFLNKVLEIEQEKFYYFMLTLKDDFRKVKTVSEAYKHQQTIIVQSGEKQTAKDFLGYEFSNRKGSEGIKIKRNEKGQAQNKMFDENNHLNPEKANSYILNHFEKQPITAVDETLKDHVKIARLTDMLDFERTEFSNSLSLNPKIHNEVESKYPIINLGEVCNTQYGYTAKAENKGEIRYLRITDINEDGTLKNEDKKYINPTVEIKKDFLLKQNDIVIARSGSTGRMFFYKNINEKLIFASYLVRLTLNEKILPAYLFSFYNTDLYWQQVNNLTIALTQPNLNAEKMKQIKIPLPPLDIQQKIVVKCEAIDKEVAKAQEKISTYKNEIEKEVQAVVNGGHEVRKLGEVFTLEYGISLPENERVQGEFPVYGSNGIVGTHNNFEVKAPCVIVGRKGSAGEINWSEKNCTPIDTTFYVKLLDSDDNELKFIFYLLKSLNLPSMKVGSGSGGINRNNIYNIQSSLPPLNIQKSLVQKVGQLEQKINEAQNVVDTSGSRKEAVLEREL